MEQALNSPEDTRVAATSAPPRKRRRILRVLGYIVLALAVIALVAHFVWRASGSNEWELAKDENGVKLWTLKTPGSGLVRVRGLVEVDSRLAGMMTLIEDLDSCVDAFCYDEKRLDQIPSVKGRAATYVRYKFDIPGLKTRDYVLFAERNQQPGNNQVDVNVIAAPNRLPRDECCVRVTHLHNHWKLTPLPNGKLEIDFMQDTDLGGLPYFFTNFALTEGTFQVLRDMQSILDKDRYKNAVVEDIREYGEN
ncbi:hypothetical protein [Bordetella tumulicola]|uniref:hypothetical protein n=1 Tax=Bordetella tumulicola TaxID=1649133 RepID=UPI0039F146A5